MRGPYTKDRVAAIMSHPELNKDPLPPTLHAAFEDWITSERTGVMDVQSFTRLFAAFLEGAGRLKSRPRGGLPGLTEEPDTSSPVEKIDGQDAPWGEAPSEGSGRVMGA